MLYLRLAEAMSWMDPIVPVLNFRGNVRKLLILDLTGHRNAHGNYEEWIKLPISLQNAVDNGKK